MGRVAGASAKEPPHLKSTSSLISCSAILQYNSRSVEVLRVFSFFLLGESVFKLGEGKRKSEIRVEALYYCESYTGQFIIWAWLPASVFGKKSKLFIYLLLLLNGYDLINLKEKIISTPIKINHYSVISKKSFISKKSKLLLFLKKDKIIFVS